MKDAENGTRVGADIALTEAIIRSSHFLGKNPVQTRGGPHASARGSTDPADPAAAVLQPCGLASRLPEGARNS